MSKPFEFIQVPPDFKLVYDTKKFKMPELEHLEPKDEYKYYTPSLEDIRVGYECEYKPDNTWNKITIRVEDFYTGVVSDFGRISLENIRTPYLTKEQIQAEGWKIGDHSMIFIDFEDTDDTKIINMIKKDGITLVIDIDDREILLGEIKLSVPSINEFRYITKNLLKAK